MLRNDDLAERLDDGGGGFLGDFFRAGFDLGGGRAGADDAERDGAFEAEGQAEDGREDGGSQVFAVARLADFDGAQGHDGVAATGLEQALGFQRNLEAAGGFDDLGGQGAEGSCEGLNDDGRHAGDGRMIGGNDNADVARHPRPDWLGTDGSEGESFARHLSGRQRNIDRVGGLEEDSGRLWGRDLVVFWQCVV